MKTILLGLTILSCIPVIGQQFLTALPIGGSKKAIVREQIGLVRVTVTYNRPAVKGREGMIWGKLVPIGFVPLGLSKEPSPWRAGANENTTIEFSDSVRINGKDLPAGKYGFFVAYSADESEIIFSKVNNSWGSFFYIASKDALRVKSRPTKIQNSVEWLRFLFEPKTDSSADLQLEWEKMKISFQISTDYKAQQLKLFKSELEKKAGENWQSWNQAAEWCLERNVNLAEALIWADSAIAKAGGLDSLFQPYGTKAELLYKMDREQEARDLILRKLPEAGIHERTNYAMLLVRIKKYKDGLTILKSLSGQNPGDYAAYISLAYGYAMADEKSNAIAAAKTALQLAKSIPEKTTAEILIGQLNNSSFRAN